MRLLIHAVAMIVLSALPVMGMKPADNAYTGPSDSTRGGSSYGSMRKEPRKEMKEVRRADEKQKAWDKSRKPGRPKSLPPERPGLKPSAADGSAMQTAEPSAPDSTTADFAEKSAADSLNIVSIAAIDGHLWMAATQGSLLHSSDGGATWDRLRISWASASVPHRLRQIRFTDTVNGYFTGTGGALFATPDGGRIWRRQNLFPQRDIRVLIPLDRGRVIVVDSAGTLYDIRAGADPQWSATKYPGTLAGAVCRLAESPDNPDHKRSSKWNGPQADKSMIVLAGIGGRIYRGSDAGSLQAMPPVPGRPALFSVAFLDTSTGFVGGERGLIARTRDGGNTWDTLSVGNGGKVLALAFLDRKHGFAAGEKGLLFETRNGGRSWQPAARSPAAHVDGEYLRFPPPAYFLLLLIAAGLVWPVLRERKPEVVEESIADQLVSDRPLVDERFDVLGLAGKAKALADFLGNPRTEPPLTFGIMGEWGRGKSSFMNLLRNRLNREGFTTVWFNAWHHQNEESLLASLLETVKRTRIPPWWTLDGARFRINLIRKRIIFGRETDWMFLLAGLVAFLVLCRWNPLHLHWNYVSLEAFLESLSTGKWTERLAGAGGYLVTLLPLGVSFLTFLRLARKALVVFDTQPGRLLADLAGSATLKDMSAKIGFREEFRKEFSEVAEALRHAPLVVFIDDLDRCQPGKVMEILESINFLVTCGPCYFVVAMDKRQITRAIIVNDEAIIRLFNDKGEAHAQEYLEKIINIEVPVPEPDAKAYQRLMTAAGGPAAAKPVEDTRWQTALKNSPVYLVLVFLLYLSGALLHAPSAQSPGAVDTTKTDPAGSKNAVGQATAAAGQALDLNSVEMGLPFAWDSAPTSFQDGIQAAWTRPFAVAIPVLSGGLLAWAVLAWSLQRRRRSFRDSKAFLGSVDEWHGLIFLGAKTPRAVKRFLNRLRFLAVLSRNASHAGSGRSLGDPDLVALATLELGMKAMLPDTGLNRESLLQFEQALRKDFPDSPLPDRVRDLCRRQDIDVLLQRFGNLGDHARLNG